MKRKKAQSDKAELKWSKFTLFKMKTWKRSYISTIFFIAQLKKPASFNPFCFALVWVFLITRQFQQETLLINLDFFNVKFRNFYNRVNSKQKRLAYMKGKTLVLSASHPFQEILHYFKYQFFNFTKQDNWQHISGDTMITGDSTWLFPFSWNVMIFPCKNNNS